MIFWIIVVLVFLGVFLSFKMNNFRTKFAFFFIIIGISFLLLTGFIFISGKSVDVSSVDGVSSALKTYVSWLGNAGSNLVKISTYAFNQEWKGDAGNSTG